jgi:hypothetical protein
MKTKIFRIVINNCCYNRGVFVVFNSGELIDATEYLTSCTKCRVNRCRYKPVLLYIPLFWMRYCKCNVIKNKEPIFFYFEVTRGSSLQLRNYATVSLSCCYSRKRKAPLFCEFITETREHLNYLLSCGKQ